MDHLLNLVLWFAIVAVVSGFAVQFLLVWYDGGKGDPNSVLMEKQREPAASSQYRVSFFVRLSVLLGLTYDLLGRANSISAPVLLVLLIIAGIYLTPQRLFKR